jgi:hypothetical protein
MRFFTITEPLGDTAANICFIPNKFRLCFGTTGDGLIVKIVDEGDYELYHTEIGCINKSAWKRISTNERILGLLYDIILEDLISMVNDVDNELLTNGMIKIDAARLDEVWDSSFINFMESVVAKQA